MSADLLTRLIEARTPAGLVAEVALLIARAETTDQAIAARRASDRDRQSRRRNVTSRDVTAEPAPAPPSPKAPQTPKEPQPPHPHPEVFDALAYEAAWRWLAVVIAGCEFALAKSGKRRWPRDMPPPSGVSADQWAGFVEHRARKRQSLTHRAYELLCTKLAGLAEDGWPPGELIDTAVDRGWITVFPPTSFTHGQRPYHDRPGDRPSGWAPQPGMAGAEPASLDDERAGAAAG